MDSIQVPNILGNYLQGREARREVDKQNFMATNAPAIMAGDPNAMAEYARFAPQEAMTMMQQQQQMAMQRQQFEMARASAAREAEAALRDGRAEATAAEAEATRKFVAGALYQQTPEQFDAYVSSNGQPDLAGQFENRQSLAAMALGSADAIDLWLKNAQPPKPLSPRGQEQADINAGLIAPEVSEGFRPATPEESAAYGTPGQMGPDGRFYPINKPSGTSLTVDPETGAVSFAQGSGVGGAPSLTVDAAKNTGYLERLRASGPILDDHESQGTSLGQSLAAGVPLAGNYVLTPEYQQYDQAKRDFVNAILRRESGAVISDSEFENAEKQYFPRPGDSPEVIAQKRANRAAAIRGIEIGAGAGAGLVTPKKEPGGVPTPQEIQGMTQDEYFQFMNDVDITSLPDEVLKAMLARGQ